MKRKEKKEKKKKRKRKESTFAQNICKAIHA